MLFSSYDWPKILLQCNRKVYQCAACVSYNTVSITFCLVYSKNKKVIGHASTRHMDVKSLGLVMEFRLHTNVTVIFHSTVLMVNQHANRIPLGILFAC